MTITISEITDKQDQVNLLLIHNEKEQRIVVSRGDGGYLVDVYKANTDEAKVEYEYTLDSGLTKREVAICLNTLLETLAWFVDYQVCE